MSGEQPPIVVAIARAYDEANAEYEAACSKAATWVARTGWRLTDEHFEDLLLSRVRLSESDCAELRAFRARLIEERVAE